MGADEEGTLARLKAIRKSLVDPTIAAHRGRIVKTTGDGMLVVFASAVDAVRGAIEVQRSMSSQSTDVQQDNRIVTDLGPQTLKNIAEPMRVWEVEPGQGAAKAQPGPPAGAAPTLALPDKPSIAVLPFQNMSAILNRSISRTRGGGYHHSAPPRSSCCSLSRAIRVSPTREEPSISSRSGANSASVMCWRQCSQGGGKSPHQPDS